MKKMLFIIPSFQHGGTNRSFCNLIDLFDFKSHNISIDLLCIKKTDDIPYFSEFKNRGINILDENIALSLPHYYGKNIFRKAVRHMLKLLPQKIIDTLFKLSCMKYNNKYDAVVSMEEGISSRIASYIKAPETIAWLRCMYDRYYKLINQKDETDVYDKIDKIVCVSNDCRNSLLSVYPQYKKKTVCIPNTQNREKILNKAQINPDVVFSKNYFNIVSVGRLDKVKQFHLIPQIVRELLENNFNLKWYIIGDGHYKNKIVEQIEKYSVADNVILLGSKDNPYPLMSQADLIAITSSSESFCNVISEGSILNKKIISTPFPAVYDTMGNYENGTICDLCDFSTKIKEISLLNISTSSNVKTNKDDVKVLEFIKRLENIF